MKNDANTTPLHIAASEGNTASIDTLLASNVDLYAQDENGDTPAHLAIRNHHYTAAKKLFDASKKKEGIFVTGPLLVDAKNNLGDTPLHEAVKVKDLAICRLIVEEHDPELFEKNNFGQIPLHIAAMIGNIKMGKVLFGEKEKGSFVKGNNGMDALMIALNSGNIGFAHYLLTQSRHFLHARDSAGNCALHYAVNSADLAITCRITRFNPALLLVDNRMQNTPIHLALLTAFEKYLSYLIKAFEVDFSAATGNTSTLHYCARTGLIDTARFLLQNTTCTVDMLNGDEQQTPLMVALQHKKNDFATMLVTEFGAKLNTKNILGCTPLHYAAGSNMTVECLRLMLSLSNDINVRANSGFTPLHMSALNGTYFCAKVLKEHSADETVVSIAGDTPLQVATKTRFKSVGILNLLKSDTTPVVSDLADSRASMLLHQKMFGSVIESSRYDAWRR